MRTLLEYLQDFKIVCIDAIGLSFVLSLLFTGRETILKIFCSWPGSVECKICCGVLLITGFLMCNIKEIIGVKESHWSRV